MKKLISLLIVFATVLSLCACDGDPAQNTDTSGATEASTEASEPTAQTPAVSAQLTPEQLYGHINQLEPVDGVYKIWSEVGVQNMADHPDATFELLCNVDMGGATVAPIGTADKPFTGEIKGANFTVSNFTVQGGEETDFGFVAVNKGGIHNFLIQNVTFVPGANASNIGSLVGDNQGEVMRCTVTGTMNVENAAEGANCGSLAGTSTGTIANTVINVDLKMTAPGTANVGGIAGSMNGGTAEFLDTNGKLEVTGSNKQVGLFAGFAKDIQVRTLAFIGAANTVDGVLFTNHFGTEENVTKDRMLVRDNANHAPLTEGQQKLRQRVVQEMYEMGTIKWYVTESMAHTCTCTATQCHGTFAPGFTYIGIPYNHKNGSMTRFLYCMDPENTEQNVVADWVYDTAEYDGHDLYMGNDCSTAVLQAWLTVSNSVDFIRSSYGSPAKGLGTIAVGDWVWDLDKDMTQSANMRTDLYTKYNGSEVMYEAYAQLRMGDAVGGFTDKVGHNRMVAQDAVVVRDETGKIDSDYSYVLFHEQGPTSMDDATKTYTTWRINFKYTFTSLYNDGYIPITIEELITGEMEPVECTLEGGVDDSRLGLTIGTVKANYSLDSVDMRITDEMGKVVFEHTMFPTATKRWDDNANDTLIRRVIMEYDLVGFTAPLQNVEFEQGATYHATITGNLQTGDSIVVKDFSFVNG